MFIGKLHPESETIKEVLFDVKALYNQGNTLYFMFSEEENEMCVLSIYNFDENVQFHTITEYKHDAKRLIDFLMSHVMELK